MNYVVCPKFMSFVQKCLHFMSCCGIIFLDDRRRESSTFGFMELHFRVVSVLSAYMT